MDLFIFGRFHAAPGQATQLADACAEVVGPTRAERGCIAIASYRTIRDPQLFWIHSRWIDDASFEAHALLPHTVHFIYRVQELVDEPIEVARTHLLT